MLRIFYKSKIHKAAITQTQVDYEGSIGIDANLMKAAEILPHEKVQVLNLNTGVRFETYAIEERRGSGTICLYGPAAHLGKVGEKILIISYCLLEQQEIGKVKPKAVYLDEQNKIKERQEKNG